MKKVFLLLVFISLMAGCKKYPDDVLVPHFRTPDGRLVGGTWTSYELDSITINAVISQSDNAHIIFEKKGVFQGVGVSRLDFIGSWKLTNKNKDLEITDDKGHMMQYVIKQLDHDKLVFVNESIRYTFKPRKLH